MYSKTISPRRGITFLNSDMEESASNQDAKRQFEDLLITPVERITTNNDIRNKCNFLNEVEPINSAYLYNQIREKISFNSLHNQAYRLKWQLTNGPLKGLIIEADYTGIAVMIIFTVNIFSHYEKINGVITELENLFSQEFNYPITLKVNDANTSTR
ncbi:hypothetical protein [Providencia rettgeri]|uniref:hypothetical protein n=1 Tax=Providencia rettgeri TaxID=587 RepID=UPI0034E0B678